jgi:hypothetical protein
MGGLLIVPHRRTGRESRHVSVRVYNDRLAGSARRHHFDDDIAVPFLCECDDEECQEYAPLTLQQFSQWHETLILTAREHTVSGAIAVERTALITLHAASAA